MSGLFRLVELIYEETNVGRCIATSLSGVVALIVYVLFKNWIPVVLAFVIVFPFILKVATWLDKIVSRRSSRREKRKKASEEFDQFSVDEKEVVLKFVKARTCHLVFSQFDRLSLSNLAVESLVERGWLQTSMTECGGEVFELDVNLYDVSQDRINRSNCLDETTS